MGSELGVTADTKPHARLDHLGIWWITWATFWTICVASGMAYLIVNRRVPLLRIRGLGLSLFATTLLHLYWISCQIGYIIGPLAPGDGEYWIMGTYFPLGIALFHASNTRFLYVAKQQRRYAEGRYKEAPRVRGRGPIASFRRMTYTAKMLTLVGLGMIFQLFMTIFIYLISRKFHESWGIPGTEVHGTPMEKLGAMGRGWEWWPTCFWQLLWAWVVAPIVLWKSRHVNDTQGWRFQTFACAISGLPAVPMWLIALYVPAMEQVNQYWVPPQWICLSIFFMEIFTVFVPCWQVMAQRRLSSETKASIAQWETKSKMALNGTKSLNTGSSVIESIVTGMKSTNESVASGATGESILTMSALEYVLDRNPTPLQQFSALRDFSGENIAFLTSVAEWKSSLPVAARNSGNPTTDPQVRELVRERYNRALRIYAEFVSVRDAQFPINISGQDLKALEAVFEASARILYGDKREVDAAVPFDSWNESGEKGSVSEPSSPHADSCVEDRVQFWGDIPEAFNETVFDKAEDSIKYLVLTNTWPKFIRDHRRASGDSGELEAGNNLVNMARE
ncbi:hypothetical protein VHEMI03279 [[Torrubiella] hemipterigena]|uniref:RGS domain-containing protein n=1 Tax=[Torrubiella] hemipterigena TaxID=1531966 RepID=A0A0A1TAR7_9HYPO|nr:hypothetical protein VHEMI03279 [[Torrubiella] hemipterigena]